MWHCHVFDFYCFWTVFGLELGQKVDLLINVTSSRRPVLCQKVDLLINVTLSRLKFWANGLIYSGTPYLYNCFRTQKGYANWFGLQSSDEVGDSYIHFNACGTRKRYVKGKTIQTRIMEKTTRFNAAPQHHVWRTLLGPITVCYNEAVHQCKTTQSKT